MSAATPTATTSIASTGPATAMAEPDIDVLLVSVGRDLPYLTGYEAMPLERLTMLVVPRDGDATLVVPRLEAPRVVEQPDVFTLAAVERDRRPDRRRRRPGRARRARPPSATTMWARFLVDLLPHWPSATHVSVRADRRRSSPLRMRKDAAEIAALRGRRRRRRPGRRPAAGGRDPAGRPHRGRGRRPTLGAGCSPRATTGSTSPSSPPARTPPARTTTPATGSSSAARSCCATSAARWTATAATSPAACSLGEPPAEIAEAYAVLHEAQRAAVAGRPSSARRARRSTASPARSSPPPATASYFIHRTGHGIGMEEHEDPYIVEGNGLPLEPGHAFSVEPGIYVPGRWGMRLEDIVVATDAGPAPSTTPTTHWSASTPDR